MKKVDLNTISKEIQKFCDIRGWKHTDPNHLITSLNIEIGELSEHYQWEKTFKKFQNDEKTEVGYEFVDVLFYLLRLAQLSDIDISKYFYEKLPKLEEKFPIGMKSKVANQEYRKSGKNRLYK